MIVQQQENVNWSKTGLKLFESNDFLLEDGSQITHEYLLSSMMRIRGFKPSKSEKLPMMFSMALNKIVKVMGYGEKRTIAVGVTNELAPYGLYSVTYAYKNKVVTGMWVDTGCSLICAGSIVHIGDPDQILAKYEVLLKGVSYES